MWVVLHALSIKICPYTRKHDIMRLVDPILFDTVISIEDFFLATVKKNPSILPHFAVIISLEESTVDLLVQELASITLYSI